MAPEVGNTVLNVAGSDWVLNLLTSPSFAAQKKAFIDGLAAQGIAQNSPTYDQFLGIAKWIIDPADPVNAAYYLTHSAKLPAPLPPNINPASRRAFIQWILDDQVVVNLSTVELVNAGIRRPRLGPHPRRCPAVLVIPVQRRDQPGGRRRSVQRADL